ncbi:hypothetical protein EYF80_032022 [Liparis tanakae]|uniref:Uncharacterized protein n=1 Tax=Liparis tanakae TaxID=230148 RepID=A0A4Z2GYQ9_9TELE|nr:hypothetical protein EYF80_032022 [Liparis tanakae]
MDVSVSDRVEEMQTIFTGPQINSTLYLCELHRQQGFPRSGGKWSALDLSWCGFLPAGFAASERKREKEKSMILSKTVSMRGTHIQATPVFILITSVLAQTARAYPTGNAPLQHRLSGSYRPSAN